MAELARLRLTGAEGDRLTGELNDILALVDRLDDLPEQQQERDRQQQLEDPRKPPEGQQTQEPQQTQEVQEAQDAQEPEEAQGGSNAEAQPPDPLHRSIAELAPRSEESFFLVPKLPAHDDPGDPDG